MGDGDGSLSGPDGVAPSRMVGVSASVNLPLHHKFQKKISSGTGSPGKRAIKQVCVCVCVCVCVFSYFIYDSMDTVHYIVYEI